MIRLFNRIVALVLGLALAAAGVVVIIEAVSTWTSSGFLVVPGTSWLKSFETTPWSAPIVIAISSGVAVVGILLLVFEVRPERKRVVPYQTDTAGEWQLMRRSTETHLQRRLTAQVPTSPIKARLKPGRKWSLAVKARSAASTRSVLETAGKSELHALHAPENSQVQVKTTGAKTS